MSRVSSVQDDSNIHSPATPMNSLVGIKVNVPAAMYVVAVGFESGVREGTFVFPSCIRALVLYILRMLL